MSTREQTFRKDETGAVLTRVVITQVDTVGTVFTVTDEEKPFDPDAHLPQLEIDLDEIQAEIVDLQRRETETINMITGIEDARDTVR